MCRAVPKSAPTELRISAHNSTAAEVQWKTVSDDSIRGFLKGYKVIVLLLNGCMAAWRPGRNVIFAPPPLLRKHTNITARKKTVLTGIR